ncbi:MAG: tRNA guanosine(34) transglycosylase Tgt [Candidatus Vogelbacteria bacterium]|nr:tRNA guanosine(34) transglycosylase Tgt [Candidatus Vogelbacteria bacterium]
MSDFNFKIEKKMKNSLGRAGVIHTARGDIETPAFVTVGTKATVKALTPEMVNSLGAQVVLANTYHLYLQPGDELVKKAGGLHKFMNYDGPMMTDSGGFQVFSLGAAYGEGGISKFTSKPTQESSKNPYLSISNLENPIKLGISENGEDGIAKLAKIDEDGVTFKSVIDGSEHRFTPERSMQIQHNLGADIIFAFDECTSPLADYEYQKEAMKRTHRWAERSLAEHQRLSREANSKSDLVIPLRNASRDTAQSTTSNHPLLDSNLPRGLASWPPALFGIVQGGRHQDLREESARVIGAMDFDGFGIGGSFNKEDMGTAVGWVSKILPEDKPRHLLGIGEPADIIEGVKNGADTFDCVTPTRMARNGTLMVHSAPPSQSYGETKRLNIFNAQYREDFGPIEEGCGCYTCQLNPDGTAKYSRAYLAHLFRAKEILASTLASIHNLYFLINLTKQIRRDILEGRM